jgi:hypothetical protein
MSAPDWKPAISPYGGERQMLYNGLIDATLISLLYRRSPRDPAIAEDVLQGLPVLASSCGILLKLGTVTPASESLFSGQRHIKRVAGSATQERQ